MERRSSIFRLVSLLLFGIGVVLCVSFLSRMFGWAAVVGVGLAMILFQWINQYLGAQPAQGEIPALQRIFFWASALALWVFHGIAIFLALAWGQSLWWATTPLARIAVVVTAIAWLVTLLLRSSLRFPLILPLGVWIVACLTGWLAEEGFVRCDDYSALSPTVRVLMPTVPDRCATEKRIPIGRYPRKFWQSRDGRWLRFTTQASYEHRHPAGRFHGLVCEIDLNAADPVGPRCVGGTEGKSHGIVGADSIDKVLFAAWSLPPDDRGRKGAIFTLPQAGPIAIENQMRLAGSVGDMIYEPKSDIVRAFCDSNDRVLSFHLSTGEALPQVEAPIFPGEVRYYPERDEGVICGWPIATAVTAEPFAYRLLGWQAPSLLSLAAISWGCDWDPATRRIYAAIATLGMLYEVDFDSGKVLNRHWIGFGMRSTTLDRDRGVVYVTDFLGGSVVAFDIHNGEERRRWFVGHFVREAKIARDGQSLFVSSNLGVLQIPLT